jgi:hypothetical protein
LRRFLRLTHLQYAVDGCWEEAVSLVSDQPPPSFQAVRCWVGKSTDFALEIFFKDPDGLSNFVGVRWKGKSAAQVAELVQTAHATLASANPHKPDEALAAFDAALGTNLLRSSPAFLEIGVNNLWKSVGSLVVWRPGRPVPAKDELDSNLRLHAPQLLLQQPNAVMLEIGYVEPQPHWLGLCVSRRLGDQYQLDLDRVLTTAWEFAGQTDIVPLSRRRTLTEGRL